MTYDLYEVSNLSTTSSNNNNCGKDKQPINSIFYLTPTRPMKRARQSTPSTNQQEGDLCTKQTKLSTAFDHTSEKKKYNAKTGYYQDPSIALMEILSNESYLQIRCTSSKVRETIPNPTNTWGKDKDTNIMDALDSSVVSDFLESTWQLHPVYFKKQQQDESYEQKSPKIQTISNNENATSTNTHLLKNTLTMGWNGVMNMLEQSRKYDNEIKASQPYHPLKPLFLQNQQPLQHVDIEHQYASNPFAAYLDGCSIIQNHAEYFSTPLSEVCLDLQKSFPHCYCNTYLTPPNSSTVNAHADDRDVFVIQIKGKKKWKVYRKVPVQYPYQHEQVGKNDLRIPPSVMKDDIGGSSYIHSTSDEEKSDAVLIEATLEEGDILYMPRGYVHEASTTDCDNQPSFHATIAIMTSDWSYSKTVADMTRTCLDKEVGHRMAVHVDVGRKDPLPHCVKEQLEIRLESIFQRLKEQITVASVCKELRNRYALHNQNSDCMRKRLNAIMKGNEGTDSDTTSGPIASRFLTVDTEVRASTPMERESIACGERGLTVRDETSNALLSIIGKMKEDTGLCYKVLDLSDLVQDISGRENICDFTLCSFVKCCIDLGVMSVNKPNQLQ